MKVYIHEGIYTRGGGGTSTTEVDGGIKVGGLVVAVRWD